MSEASLNVKLKLDLSDAEAQLKTFSGAAKKVLGGNISGAFGSSSPMARKVKDDSAALEKYWKNLEKIDKVGKSLLFGNWKKSELPVKKIIGLKEPDYGKELGKIHSMGSLESQFAADDKKKQEAIDKSNKAIERAKKKEENDAKKKAGVPLEIAFSGMLRSLIMYRTISEAFKMLKASVDNVTESFGRAQKVYSKSLTSGLGVGLTQQRSAQSAILGVSEEEVMKFGAALQWLNPQIQKSVERLTALANPLAATQMMAGALMLKIQALGATIAVALKPSIDSLISSLSAVVDVLMDAGIIESILVPAVNNLVKFAQVAGIIVTGLSGIFTLFIDGLKLIGAHIYNLIQRLLHPISGGDQKDTNSLAEAMREHLFGLAKSLDTQWANLFGKGDKTGTSLPQPQAFMKQLPASSWEKMGLVIGGKGNTTNELIKTSNRYLKTISDHVAGTGRVPRAFGLNPNVSNP